MDIKDLDIKKLNVEEKERAKKILEYMKKNGHFCETDEDEKKLMRRINASALISPCKLCSIISDNSNLVKDFCMPNLKVLKNSKSTDECRVYEIVPYKHISNSDFISMGYLGFIGTIIDNIKNSLEAEVGVVGFSFFMDNFYGSYWSEHAKVIVKFVCKKRGE